MRDEKYLTICGFRRFHFDNVDLTAYWIEKRIKHKFLTGLHIIIESNEIQVWCKEMQKGELGDILIHRCKYTPDKLNEIMEWLKK